MKAAVKVKRKVRKIAEQPQWAHNVGVGAVSSASATITAATSAALKITTAMVDAKITTDGKADAASTDFAYKFVRSSRKSRQIRSGRITHTSTGGFVEFDCRCRRAQGSASSVVMDLFETFVPAQARGRGIARIVVAEAFCFARARGWRVHPSCSYVRDTYLPRHPLDEASVLPSLLPPPAHDEGRSKARDEGGSKGR